MNNKYLYPRAKKIVDVLKEYLLDLALEKSNEWHKDFIEWRDKYYDSEARKKVYEPPLYNVYGGVSKRLSYSYDCFIKNDEIILHDSNGNYWVFPSDVEIPDFMKTYES